MTLIDQWQQSTESDKSRCKEGLSQLKNMSSIDDQVIANTSQDISSKIDCLQCANCCKTTPTTFDISDINRAAKSLGVSKKSFVKQYLFEDIDGVYTTMSTPCPMLLSDNTCRIYEARPQACNSFPHTQRSHFFGRSKVHRENIDVCPITYHVVKKLMQIGH